MEAVRILFSLHGRIGRVQYLLGLTLLLWFFAVFVITAESAGASSLLTAVVFLMIPALALTPWIILALAVKRLHDLGLKGAWCWALFVPLLNFVVVLMLIFSPGQQYDNQYGPGSAGQASEVLTSTTTEKP